MRARATLPLSRLAGAVAASVLLLALTGCAAPEPEGTPTPSKTRTSSPTPTPTVTPTATPTPTADAASDRPTVETIDCNDMLDAPTDTRLRGLGLEPAPKEFGLLGFTPSGAGIECPWGDPNLPPSMADHYYVWAELTPEERVMFIETALESGYEREDSARGSWLTSTVAEESGFGVILVGDDYVALATDRAEIDSIVWAG